MNRYWAERQAMCLRRSGSRCFSWKTRAKRKSSREADLNHRPKDVNLIFPTTVLRSTNWAIARCVLRAKNKTTLGDIQRACCTLKCHTSVCSGFAIDCLAVSCRFALCNTVDNATLSQTQKRMNGCKRIQDWHPHDAISKLKSEKPKTRSYYMYVHALLTYVCRFMYNVYNISSCFGFTTRS